MTTHVKLDAKCVEFLISEVEKLRRTNELLGAENNVMHNFFGLVDRLGAKQNIGYAEDRLWQAKKEFADAVYQAEKLAPQVGST